MESVISSSFSFFFSLSFSRIVRISFGEGLTRRYEWGIELQSDRGSEDRPIDLEDF